MDKATVQNARPVGPTVNVADMLIICNYLFFYFATIIIIYFLRDECEILFHMKARAAVKEVYVQNSQN